MGLIICGFLARMLSHHRAVLTHFVGERTFNGYLSLRLIVSHDLSSKLRISSILSSGRVRMPIASSPKSFRTLCKFGGSRPVLVTRSPIFLPLSVKTKRCVNGFSGPSPGQVGPEADDAEENPRAEKDTPRLRWAPTVIKMFESSATTFASILVLGLVV